MAARGGAAAAARALAVACVLRRAAGDQLLGAARRAMQAGDARARAVQPVLPEAGAAGNVAGDHLEGHGDPGNVRATRELRRLEADDEVQDRDPRVRGHGRALAAAPEQGRGGEREAARHRRARGGQSLLVGFGPTILFVGLLVLADAPRGRRAEHARRVRPLARAPLRAHRRPRHLRRRGRHRGGEGGAGRGRRLPAPPRAST